MSTVQGEDSNYKFAAFISYRHREKDRRAADWLHKGLETYLVPAQIDSPHLRQRRIGRVFRDEAELVASSDLGGELRASLDASRFLLVICSPNTPESEWVAEEIRHFDATGRGDAVIPVLIEGEPDVSYPSVLRQPETGPEAGHEREPLAADVRPRDDLSPKEVRHRALLRIIARMLGVDYDALYRRDRRRRRTRALQAGALVLAVLAALGVLWAQSLKEKERADAEERGRRHQAALAREEAKRADAEAQEKLRQKALAEQKAKEAAAQTSRAEAAEAAKERERLLKEEQQRIAEEERVAKEREARDKLVIALAARVHDALEAGEHERAALLAVEASERSPDASARARRDALAALYRAASVPAFGMQASIPSGRDVRCLAGLAERKVLAAGAHHEGGGELLLYDLVEAGPLVPRVHPLPVRPAAIHRMDEDRLLVWGGAGLVVEVTPWADATEPRNVVLPPTEMMLSPEVRKISALAATPGRIAWIENDRTWLWDLNPEHEAVPLPGAVPRGTKPALHFSPDGSHVVASNERPYVVVWDISARKAMRLQDAATSVKREFHGARFSGDSKRVLATREDGKGIAVWDLTRGDIGHRFPRYGSFRHPVFGVAGSGREAVRAVGVFEKGVVLWDEPTGGDLLEIPYRGGFDLRVAFIGARMIALSRGSDLRVFTRDVPVRRTDISQRVYVPLGDSIEVAEVGAQAVRAWRGMGATGRHGVAGLAFHPRHGALVAAPGPPQGGKSLTSGMQATLFELGEEAGRSTVTRRPFRLRASEAVGRHGGSESAHAAAVAFVAQGAYMVAGTGAEVHLWRADAPAAPAAVLSTPRGSFRVVARAEAEAFEFVTAGGGGVDLWWRTSSDAVDSVALPGTEGHLWSLAIALDGTRVAAGDKDGRVFVWQRATTDTRSFAAPLVLSGHTGPVTALAFHPTRDVLVSGDDRGGIRARDLANAPSSGREWTLPSSVRGLDFTRDGGRVFAILGSSVSGRGATHPARAVSTGSASRGTLFAMEFGGDEPALPVKLASWPSALTALAIDPTSSEIAVGTEDQLVFVTPLKPPSLRDALRSLARRNLTQAEWVGAFGSQIPYARTRPDLPEGR